MIVSTQEIHNVLDLAHTGPDADDSVGMTVHATSPFDAAPPAAGGLTAVADSASAWTTLRESHGPAFAGTAFERTTFEPPVYKPRHPSPQPVLPGQDRRWRHIRVHDLRRQLADGRYAVIPDIVADKIIGRALCDQVSRLYDR